MQIWMQQVKLLTGKLKENKEVRMKRIYLCKCCKKNPIKNKQKNALYCLECGKYVIEIIYPKGQIINYQKRTIKRLEDKIISLKNKL